MVKKTRELMVPFGTRLPPYVKTELEKLAKAVDETPSAYAAGVLTEHIGKLARKGKK